MINSIKLLILKIVKHLILTGLLLNLLDKRNLKRSGKYVDS